jgi:hypothetical protein
VLEFLIKMGKLSPEAERRWQEVMGVPMVFDDGLMSGCDEEYVTRDSKRNAFCYLGGERTCNHQSSGKELIHRGGSHVPSERCYRCGKH